MRNKDRRKYFKYCNEIEERADLPYEAYSMVHFEYNVDTVELYLYDVLYLRR